MQKILEGGITPKTHIINIQPASVIFNRHCKMMTGTSIIMNNWVQNMKDVLYEMRCLKSKEDMILALTGEFKQMSHEPSYNTRENMSPTN